MGALISRIIWSILHFRALGQAAGHAQQAQDARRVRDLQTASTHAELAVRLLGATWAASRKLLWPIQEQMEYGRLLAEIRLQLKDGAGAEKALEEVSRLARILSPDNERVHMEISARLVLAVFLQGYFDSATRMREACQREMVQRMRTFRERHAMAEAECVKQNIPALIGPRMPRNPQQARAFIERELMAQVASVHEKSIAVTEQHFASVLRADDEVLGELVRFSREMGEANDLLKRRRCAAALEIYDRILDRVPRSLPAMHDKAVCLLALRRPDAALKLIASAEQALQDAHPSASTAQEHSAMLSTMETLRKRAMGALVDAEMARADKLGMRSVAQAIEVIDALIARLPPSPHKVSACTGKIQYCMQWERYGAALEAAASTLALLDELPSAPRGIREWVEAMRQRAEALLESEGGDSSEEEDEDEEDEEECDDDEEGEWEYEEDDDEEEEEQEEEDEEPPAEVLRLYGSSNAELRRLGVKCPCDHCIGCLSIAIQIEGLTIEAAARRMWPAAGSTSAAECAPAAPSAGSCVEATCGVANRVILASEEFVKIVCSEDCGRALMHKTCWNRFRRARGKEVAGVPCPAVGPPCAGTVRLGDVQRAGAGRGEPRPGTSAPPAPAAPKQPRAARTAAPAPAASTAAAAAKAPAPAVAGTTAAAAKAPAPAAAGTAAAASKAPAPAAPSATAAAPKEPAPAASAAAADSGTPAARPAAGPRADPAPRRGPHARTEGDASQPPGPPLRCDACNKTFNGAAQRDQHLASDAHKRRTAPREAPRPAPAFDAGTRARRFVPCRYFGTPEGCFRGDSCHFLHDPDLRSAPPAPPASQSAAGDDWDPWQAAAWRDWVPAPAPEEFPPLASPPQGRPPARAGSSGPSFAQAAARAVAPPPAAARPAPRLAGQLRATPTRPYRPPLRPPSEAAPAPSCLDGYDSVEEPPEYCLSPCCVCHERLATIRLRPCGHEVLCFFCLGRLRQTRWREQRPECPVCRRDVCEVQRRRREQAWEEPPPCGRCRETPRRRARPAQVRLAPCGHLAACLRCVREAEAAGGAPALAACPVPGCKAAPSAYGPAHDARPHPNAAPAPAMGPGPADAF